MTMQVLRILEEDGRKQKTRLESVCLTCGKIFHYLECNRIGKFCSMKCYSKYRKGRPRKPRIKLICEQCGKERFLPPSIAEIRRFCSRMCAGKWQSENNKGEKNHNWRGGDVTRICKWCDKEFKAPERKVRKGRALYCSYECYGIAQRTKPIKICKNCNQAFWKKGNKYFCSKKCTGEYHTGENNPFYRGKFSKEAIRKILRAVHKTPNLLEAKAMSLIRDNDLPFKYVGSGEIIIGGKCPDFIHLNDRKIIEVFGDYWHDPVKRDVRPSSTYEGTMEHYEKHGYECLILWEKEFKSSEAVLIKMNAFTEGK